MTAGKSASALWFGVAAAFGMVAVGCNTDSNLSAILGGTGSSPASVGHSTPLSPDEEIPEGDAIAEGEESQEDAIASSESSSGDNMVAEDVPQSLAPVSADQLNQMAASIGTAQRGSFTADELEGINRPGVTVPARQQEDSDRVPETAPALETASTLDQPSASPETSGTVVQTANVPRPGSDGMQLVRTTAYCHKEADSLPYGTLTAAGTQLQFGSVVRSAAADWSVYPVGTQFRILGLPYTYVVDDYGSALAGTDTIDIYQPTFSQMHRWGVRNVPVQIIQWGSYQKSAEILEGRKHVPHADHVRQMLRSIEKKGYKGHRRAGARA